MTNLFAKYPNLNTGNTVGNYSGKLSHNGELVALAMPETLYGTNTIFVEEDEVTYGTGGRWGEWSAGGGSSLELIDPHSNHRLAANWADSDDTQKSVWTNIETPACWTTAQIMIRRLITPRSACWMRANVWWTTSKWITTGPTMFPMARLKAALERLVVARLPWCVPAWKTPVIKAVIRCTSGAATRFWTGDNSCQVALNTNTLAAGQTATLALRGALAAWLAGSAVAVERQLAGSHRGHAGAEQPRHAGHAQQHAISPMPVRRFTTSPTIRPCRRPTSRWW